MSVYKPTRRHVLEVLLYYFNSNQLAIEAHRMLISAYGNGIIGQTKCYALYERFKKGDFNISRSTNKVLNKEQRIEQLVRLRLEDPGITLAEMASKVGIGIPTVHKHVNSQEFQNRLKELQQDQSCIPLESTIPRLARRERLIEQLVRLRLEDPDITQAEMATKVGKSKMTVFNYLRSQEFQNKLKEKQQEQSCTPLESTIPRLARRERLIEQLVRLRLEDPDITQAEMATKVGKSKMTVFNYLRSQEFQNKLKEKQQEQSCTPLESTIPRLARRERLIEQLVRLRLEDPGITQAEMATKVGKDPRRVSEYLRSQDYQNKLKEKQQEQSSIPLDLTVKRRRTDSDR